LLTFIGGDMVAARWKQWRFYFTDVHPTGIGPQRQPGCSRPARHGRLSEDLQHRDGPHEDLQVGALFGWTSDPRSKWSRNTWNR
jgi:arylsulfatase